MKKFPFVLILVFLFASGSYAQNGVNAATAAVPADYKSDGCSLFPDRNYGQCCVEHDKDYFKGGSWKQRWQSDNRLYKCVRRTKGWQNKFIAPVMWMGVRVFGVSFLPTSFRWGFGKKLKARELNRSDAKSQTRQEK